MIPSGTRHKKCPPKSANANNLNSVDERTFPFYRTEDIEEERSVTQKSLVIIRPKPIMSTRRLLYVACTRAQSLLYILYSSKRQIAGKIKYNSLSKFISAVCEKDEVCAIISLSDLDSVNSLSRVSSALMSLNTRPRIELSYRASWIDQSRTKKRFNAEFLNCKLARFPGVLFHSQIFLENQLETRCSLFISNRTEVFTPFH